MSSQKCLSRVDKRAVVFGVLPIGFLDGTASHEIEEGKISERGGITGNPVSNGVEFHFVKFSVSNGVEFSHYISKRGGIFTLYI